jgi:hypothetical protein
MGKSPPKTGWKIEKHDTGPAPGQYLVEEGIRKTRWMIASPPKLDDKRISFLGQA